MRDAISSRRTCWIMAIVFAALSAVGCTTPEMPMDTGQIVTSIVNGREARNVPSACLVTYTDATGSYDCTGSLVAPNVVLTAGHCVANATSWTVTCPYASDRSRVHASMGSAAPSFMGTAQLRHYGVDDAGSDLGLIRLDRALAETRVARVSISAPRQSRTIYAIGRIYHDRSTDAVYGSRINVSPLQTISDIDSRYSRWEGLRAFVNEHGDSGGPIYDNATGNIVAVASAAASRDDCINTRVCSFFAMIAPEWVWYTTTVQSYITGLIVQQSSMDCGSATTCADCTARASCGWCDGTCVSGTVDGGGSCTRAAGSWIWTQQYCTPPESTNLQNTSSTSVACESATSCGVCTELAGCGWCNGACVSGDVNGGGGCTAAASTWAWLSSECASEPAPMEDPCAVATDCDACTSMAMCGWCNGACVTGTADGGSTCTATAGDWGWLSSECPNATAPSDACTGATDCAACTALSGCGWCDGACVGGDYGGATSTTCAAWSWYSFQCM